jgi:hypothetical protein
MVHEAVALIDILAGQDVRFLEKDFSGRVHHFPGVGRIPFSGKEASPDENDHRHHEAGDRRPFQLFQRHSRPPDERNTDQSIIVWTLKTKPFVLSLSKHERRNEAPFDKLRVNGDRLGEEHWNLRRLLKEYVFSIMASL